MTGEVDTTCPVCLEEWTNEGDSTGAAAARYPAERPCGHVLCDECEARLAEGEDDHPVSTVRCPLCRAEAPLLGPAWARVARSVAAGPSGNVETKVTDALRRAYARGAALVSAKLEETRATLRWTQGLVLDVTLASQRERDSEARRRLQERARHQEQLVRLQDQLRREGAVHAAEGQRLRQECDRLRLEVARLSVPSPTQARGTPEAAVRRALGRLSTSDLTTGGARPLVQATLEEAGHADWLPWVLQARTPPPGTSVVRDELWGLMMVVERALRQLARVGPHGRGSRPANQPRSTWSNTRVRARWCSSCATTASSCCGGCCVTTPP